jgi:hypothetical protein
MDEPMMKFFKTGGENYAQLVYNMLQCDPCFPGMRVTYMSAGTERLLKEEGLENFFDRGNTTMPAKDDHMPRQWVSPLSRHGHAAPDAMRPRKPVKLYTVLGCGSPKLRLVSEAVFAESDSRAFEMVRTAPDIDSALILSGAPVSDEASSKKSGPLFSETGNKIEVTRFTANSLRARVLSSDPAWLVYADSWHPGWHARIDGRPTAVAKAYGAFKAVFVPGGEHVVEFAFENGLEGVISHVLPITGTVFSSIFLLAFAATLFRRGRPDDYRSG